MILAVRNPRFRKNMATGVSGVYKRVMDLSLSSKERWDAVTRRMEKEGSAIRSNTTYEELREFVDRGEYDIVTTTTGHAGMEVRSYPKFIRLFGSRRWTLFKGSPEAGDFITSDHPVCLFAKGKPRRPGLARLDTARGKRWLFSRLRGGCFLWGEFEEVRRPPLNCRPALFGK